MKRSDLYSEIWRTYRRTATIDLMNHVILLRRGFTAFQFEHWQTSCRGKDSETRLIRMVAKGDEQFSNCKEILSNKTI